jgi:hypothetical protein
MAIINWELFLPVALLMTGCVSDGSLSALPIRRLEKGSQSGVVEPRQVVIKDKASWERLWREHQSGDTPLFELTLVRGAPNFSKRNDIDEGANNQDPGTALHGRQENARTQNEADHQINDDCQK